MLCNHDNRKENTGGLKCESLCPEECKRQGWFGIINQNSLRTLPGEEPSPSPPCANGNPHRWRAFLLLGTTGTVWTPGTLSNPWGPGRGLSTQTRLILVSDKLRTGSGRSLVPWRKPLSWSSLLIILECDKQIFLYFFLLVCFSFVHPVWCFTARGMAAPKICKCKKD